MLTIVFGTRPEYLKIKPLILALKQNNINYKLFHISQHEHIEIDLEDCQINYITLSHSENMTRLCLLSTEIMAKLDNVLENTSYLLVQGDTATAFFSALAAFHKKIPVIHLEGGLRTYDLQNPFPEEAYRSMISRIATYHLCPDEGSKGNLAKENIYKNVYVIGNTILDLVHLYSLTPVIENEVMITIHRRENWDSLLRIFNEINTIAQKKTELKFTWILHPNPSIRSQILNYIETHTISSNLLLSEPLNHFEMTSRIAKCNFLITDSGGIQEEASFLGKHCYVIRKLTERNSIPSEYITLVPDISELYSIIENKKIQLLPPCNVYGNGEASQRFIEIYKEFLKSQISLL